MAKETLIVCHDAGAAEVVSAWVRRKPRQLFAYVVEGPARKIFERKLGSDLQFIDLEAAKTRRARISKVITGTSWSTDLEKRALKWAKSEGLPTATYLDHWVNYRVRFETDNGLILPDEIFVYDQLGKQIAERELGHKNVQIVENPYWEDVSNEIRVLESHFRKTRQPETINLLFVTQPISDAAKKMKGDPNGYGYSEFSALEAFLEWLQPQLAKIGEFRLRLHPAEASGKYDEFFAKKAPSLNVKSSPNDDLLKDIAWSDWVVGCDTMAMLIGVKAKKRVLSCIPKGGVPLGMPLPEIERLFQ